MKRRNLSAAFKKRVALEAVRERKSISEIASDFQVHPVQVSKWKKQLLEGLETLFESSTKQKNDLSERDALERQLHEKIGRLTFELDWLKKKVGYE